MSAADEPVGYMERTRHYYRALGYERDYVWARFDRACRKVFLRPICKGVALRRTCIDATRGGNTVVWKPSP